MKIRTVNETFTDKEFKALVRAKGELSWHDFIMQLASDSLIKFMRAIEKGAIIQ